jgi:toxin CcdB
LAQFDVYPSPDTPGEYWLDCQSDLIEDFDSRLVVPLVTFGEQRRPTPRLHPVFEIDGMLRVMATHQASAVSKRLLDRRLMSLAEHRDQVIAAFDVLLTGV